MAQVLVADDDLEIQELLKFTFENEGYQVVAANDGEEALKKIFEIKPDMIILDINMPKLSGFEVCEKVRANNATCLIPIIILTSLAKIKDKITGIKLGADEYLAKPFEPFEIVARVEGLLKRMKESLASNPLTGLPGNVAIEGEIKHRMESGRYFSLIYVDADNFKAYNDKYGFEKGDNVIRLIAVVLRSSIAELGNSDDFLGHMGGEDFIILTSTDKASAIAEKGISVFDSMAPCQYDDEAREKGYIMGVKGQNTETKFPIISISMGITMVDPAKYSHYSQVVERAKEVLSKAKSETGSAYKVD